MPDEQVKLPKLKLYEFLYDLKELEGCIAPYLNKPLDRMTQAKIAVAVTMFVDLPVKFLQETLLQYTDRVITPQFAATLAHQIRGRSVELESGYVQLFERPLRKEWVLLYLERSEESVWRQTERGRTLHLQCKTGHPAGHRIRHNVSERWLAYLAYRIGFTRRLPYPIEQPWVLDGSYIFGYLVPQEDSADFSFEQFEVNPELKKYNQVAFKRRMRFEFPPKDEVDEDGNPTLYACPNVLSVPCTECTVPRKECPASYVL